MVLSLLFSAFAADVHPGAFNPSAAPNEDGAVQIDLGGEVGAATALLAHGTLMGATLKGSADLGRWRVGVLGGAYNAKICVQSFGYDTATECADVRLKEGPVTGWDLSAHISYGFGDERFQVRPFVATGTYTQVGAALWTRNRSGRLELDVAGGYAVRTRTIGQDQLIADHITLMPDLGVTFNDKRSDHHVRLGLISVAPTLSYRYTPGRLGFEVGATWLGTGGTLRSSISAAF